MTKSVSMAIFITTFIFSGIFAGCRSKNAEVLRGDDAEAFMVKMEKSALRNLEEKILLVGSVKARDEAVLYPRVGGKLLKNVLNEGDAVEKNDPVAYIERDEVGAVYEPAPVPSTLTGVVGRIYLDAGAHVTPQTPVAMVVDQSQVRVVLDLPERYAGTIKLGQQAAAKVDAYPQKRFFGKVGKLSPIVDPATRNVVVEIFIPNHQALLKSGMFAQVELVVGAKASAVSIPVGAILEDESGKEHVFLSKNGRAVRRDVEIGARTREFVEITKGVQAGEEVVVTGLYGLRDGSPIKKDTAQ
ncbi:MAG: efflux RND transporter periplasmic adaptor subunit [Elusimicrobia bacterium]|nr:efflux RND transporter periplasmic adaptor subunit [Elusimicrobiota bacterium]